MRLVCRAIVDGEPVPYLRVARSRDGRSYKPKKMKDAQDRIGWKVKGDNVGLEPAAGEVAVHLDFFSAVTRGDRMKDLDNCIKLVLDALNDIAWTDDRQVASIQARISRGATHPFTRIEVYELDPNEGIVVYELPGPG